VSSSPPRPRWWRYFGQWRRCVSRTAGSEPGRWHAVATFREAFFEVLGIVTAFTIAHSITLSLAVLGFITLPSRLIESTIAASVVVAALNNLYPLIEKRLWIVAFAFGLVHGLGFANVLGPRVAKGREPVRGGRDSSLENESGSVAEPKVRIHLPPAASLVRT
jgi:hypothetical protein